MIIVTVTGTQTIVKVIRVMLTAIATIISIVKQWGLIR